LRCERTGDGVECMRNCSRLQTDRCDANCPRRRDHETGLPKACTAVWCDCTRYASGEARSLALSVDEVGVRAGARVESPLINARAEGIESKPPFKRPVRFQRYDSPASAFFE
jgi:hypothetical protein